VENQKESVVGRKALADRTKDFKRISEEEKLNAFKGLLKAYQTEIDSLTKRCKFAENAFLDVYKVLAEAPDPYPLLEAAIDHTVKAAETREMEDELQRTRKENTELQKRVDGFASVEALKRKAETKAEQLEEKMDNMIQERVTQKENELNAAYDEKMRNYEERRREQDLQRQVSLVREQLRDLRMSNESNQARLLDQSQRQDQEVYAKLAEMDMVVDDLERANTRVATVERRNIATADIEAKARQFSEETSKEVSRKAAEIQQLKDSLKRYSDYDEIKRELDIMKYVEFAGLEGDLDDDNETLPPNQLGLQLPNPNATKANAHQANSLEALLATKNKRILEELTKFRVHSTHYLSELEASLQQTRDELSVTSSELEKQRALNERLEDDLLQLDQRQPNGKGKGKADGSEDSGDDALAGLNLGGKPKGTNASPARASPIPFTSSADTSILPIVTSQRDRFRQRNAELEEELRRQFQIISELRTEIRSLQADNLKLYEKVRYMQSYRENTSTSTLDPLPVLQLHKHCRNVGPHHLFTVFRRVEC
ncbi:CASP C terminal-domain-containing protein, partial [Amylostereum chailletii]